MQSAEDQVAGLRGLDRDRHGLQVPHLADQHDVGVFAQRGPQRHLEAAGVDANLPLVDQALLIGVDELDRVFDRHDVVGARPVNVVDQRGQRRGLARTRGAGDQHQAPGQLAQVDDLLSETEVLDRPNIRRYDAKDATDPLAIHEQIAAVAGQAADLVCEVAVVKLLELFPLVRRRDREEHGPRRFRRQWLPVRRHDLTVLAKHGCDAGGYVQV